jgi:hypothetical protein
LRQTGRARAAFNTWQQSSARVESFARLLGTKRTPKAAPSIDELLAEETTR